MSEVDLSDVQIKRGSVNVYARYDDGKEDKPAVGSKLNLPATVTLYKISPKRGQTVLEWEETLRDMLASASRKNANESADEEAEFIYFDHRTHEWVFKVPHFS